jgi:ribose 5-phosphate isomerase A
LVLGPWIHQEKIVASTTGLYIIVADDRKQASYLGDPSRPWRNGVPVEVLPLAYVPVIAAIRALGATNVTLRMAQVGVPGAVLAHVGGADRWRTSAAC